MPAGPYSAKVLDHFLNPRNVGVVEDADGVGEIGSPATGNMIRLSLRVERGRILEARFRTFGCGTAIATSSVLTELIIGRTLDEAGTVTSRRVSEALDGLPASKRHCAVMAEQAIAAALDDYARRHTG
jgi:nitrogen fixation NifU-like protein